MKRLTLVPYLLIAGGLMACADRAPTAAPAANVSAALAYVPGPGEAIPSGERILGQTVLEAVYDAEHAGAIGYVSTPIHAPMKANPRAWAPLYVVMYPVTSTVVTSGTTLLCQHLPVENCPDHGPGVAGLAQQMMPGVYGVGVAGHDHVMDYPGGDDFNVAWEPVVVLFTNAAAANQHLVTDAQISAAVASHDAIEIPLAAATFHCAAVAKALWDRGTPVP